jgi:hypothetical protein
MVSLWLSARNMAQVGVYYEKTHVEGAGLPAWK